MMTDDRKVSKHLEFPVGALAGVGYVPAKGKTSMKPRGCFVGWRPGLGRGW